MQRAKLLGMLAMLLSLAGCAGSDPGTLGSQELAVEQGPPFSAELEGWRVISRKPQYIDDTHIVGSFTFRHESGDEETRGGGACLLADLENHHPCKDAGDCLPPPFELGFSYCMALPGETQTICL